MGNISQTKFSYEDSLAFFLEKVKDKPELMDILEKLTLFPLGRSMIQHRGGVTGACSAYACMYPWRGRITGLNIEGKPFSELEDFILNKSPDVLAVQERFSIFQQELQKRCVEGVVMASIPCGTMDDLLSLDCSHLKNFHFIGVDIDQEVLDSIDAKKGKISLLIQDAWKLNLPEKADVITSHGLNVYEKNDARLVELYHAFHENLKPNGVLIISFLADPKEWKYSEINEKNLAFERVIFTDLLGVQWQTYRSSEETITQLKKAGFRHIDIIQDKAGIFPTVAARR